MKDEKQIIDFMNFNGKLFDFWNDLDLECDRDELRDIVEPVRNFLKQLGNPQEFVAAAKELLGKIKWLYREAESALDYEHNQDVLIDAQAAITRFEKALGKV